MRNDPFLTAGKRGSHVSSGDGSGTPTADFANAISGETCRTGIGCSDSSGEPYRHGLAAGCTC